MEIGVAMPTHGLLTRDEANFYLQRVEPEEMRVVEYAQRAEQLGYHSVWFSDHVVMGGDLDVDYPANLSGKKAYPLRPNMLDAAVVMGALAATTSRIRFAPSVHIAPYRHPLSSAHQFATVDVLSNGRLIMGVGCGWEPDEFRALAADFEHRGALTEECIQIYKLAWSEPWVEFHGRFFDISNISLDPKPVQKPHPPLVFGATTRAGARRAARTSDALYTVHLEPYIEIGVWDELRDVVREEAERIDRDVGHFRMMTFASTLPTDASDELARREPRPTLTGTAEQILSDLERFADHGYSHVTLHFHVRSGTVAELFELLDRFAREILPSAQEIEVRAFA